MKYAENPMFDPDLMVTEIPAIQGNFYRTHCIIYSTETVAITTRVDRECTAQICAKLSNS